MADTGRLAARVANLARGGDLIALSGPLGAGKTAFARAFLGAAAAARGVAPPAEVPSPTFTLVQSYDVGGLEVAHFDLYRIKDADEAAELGLDEALAAGVVLVEWPERLGPALPRNRLDIALSLTAAGERSAELTPCGDWTTRGMAP